MTARAKEYTLAAYGLATIGIAMFAFQCNRYWFVLMALYTCLNAALLWYVLSYTVCLCIVFGLGAILPLNWLITEVFFDPTVMGLNQTIFVLVLSAIVAAVGVWLSVDKVVKANRKRAADLKCKRDARDKYRIMINRVQEIEAKVGVKTDMVNDLFDKLEKLHTNG